MRIAQVDASLFSWPYDSALTLALVDAGHEVQIFGRPPRRVEETGPALALVTPHFYRSLTHPIVANLPRRLFYVWKGISHTYGMLRLVPALRAFQPDVIHFQWSPLPIIDKLFIKALRRITKTVMTVHDSTPFNGAPGAGAQLADATSIMLAFDRIIVHTQAARVKLLSYGVPSQRLKLVPHGLLERYSVDVQREGRKLGDQINVLMFGYLKPYKGIDVLLRAASSMSPQALERSSILIVGKPMMDVAPLQQMIVDLGLRGHVNLEARFVPDGEVGQLFASADILILPYRQIDASGVLMTAITAEIPVVGSRLGLVAELLEDGKHGRLVEPEDHRELARALEDVILSDEMRETMSQHMKVLHASIPTWEAIAAETVRVYEDLIA